ncbi:MAG: fibronectin type III domain-containing protein, partial [Actinomycetes bacterium]
PPTGWMAPPAAPSNLSVAMQAGPQSLLQWTDNATNETGYTVQRAANGGGFSTVATLAAGAVSYADSGVTLGTTYAYRVQAFNVAGGSAWAGPVSIDMSPPSAPSGLASTIARTAAGPDTVTLAWVNNSSNMTGFTIQRASNSTFTATLVTYTTGGGVASYVNAAAHGQTYYYRVLATNVLGASAWSNTTSAATVPATPTNLRSTARTRTSITLGWNDISGNETGYQIQRHKAGVATWTNVVTTGANVVKYVDSGRARNTTFSYRIRGRNGVGSSPWTATLKVSTLP